MQRQSHEEHAEPVATASSHRSAISNEPMKILVNATNILRGGSVQRAVEFVRASISYNTEHRFSYALSDVVTNNLRALADIHALDLLTAYGSPARPLGGRGTRSALRDLEKRLQPDVVYSVFGPAYLGFRSPHLMGFAVPWVTHPNRYAWRTIHNPVDRARHWAWCRYVAFWTRFANRWVLETTVAADGLSQVLAIERERFHVVPNVYAEQYVRTREAGAQLDVRMQKQDPSDFNLLVFSYWYPHKNLELVPVVAAEIRKQDSTRRYRFFLTFDTSSAEWKRMQRDARRLGVEDNVVNLGPIMVADGPRLYVSSDAVFMPTVLETFTATYPEAMCLRRPIVTTDLPFARDTCGDGALFFPPNDAATAAERIMSLAKSEAVRDALVLKGDKRYASGKTPKEVYEMLVEVIELTARDGAR